MNVLFPKQLVIVLWSIYYFNVSERFGLEHVDAFLTRPKSTRPTATKSSATTTNLNELSKLVDGAWVDERIYSAVFPGPLRGVATGQQDTIQPNTIVATVPAKHLLIVSNYQSNGQDIRQQELLIKNRKDNISSKDLSMWDRDLSILLWNEFLQVVQQSKSTTKPTNCTPLTGYIEYLCQQDERSLQTNSKFYANTFGEYNNPVTLLENIDIDKYVPPSTAPHSLRRWTDEQKSYLGQYTTGQQLLQIQERQDMIWKMKYDSIRKESTKYTNIRMTYPQFLWAMEVVNSRAFCGLPVVTSESGSSFSTVIQSAIPGIIAPILAATVGYVYAISALYPSETVLTGLAVAGALPLLVTTLQSLLSGLKSATSDTYKNMNQSAVLLPIIDSANHHNDAQKDTNIVYNPFRNSFEWSIGPKSLIASTPPYGQPQQSLPKQVCISYGNQKSDNEWIINYGFLPGISIDGDIDNFDDYRLFVAQAYLERNS
jgi:hypothetical protein